jgi:hypothetical protein
MLQFLWVNFIPILMLDIFCNCSYKWKLTFNFRCLFKIYLIISSFMRLETTFSLSQVSFKAFGHTNWSTERGTFVFVVSCTSKNIILSSTLLHFYYYISLSIFLVHNHYRCHKKRSPKIKNVYQEKNKNYDDLGIIKCQLLENFGG